MSDNQKLKVLASATSSSLGGGFQDGIYLLYATGDGVDFERLQRQVESVPHFNLSPFCWLVLPPPQGVHAFSESVSWALPLEDGKAELLLCHLAKSSILHGNAGGLGLSEWLRNNGYFS
jgi:hypothetical protein